MAMKEAQEKLKSRDVENVSTEVTKVIKSEKEVKYEKVDKAIKSDKPEINESFVKVLDQITQQELILYKTTRTAIYLCNQKGKNGVVFAKNNIWFFEYLENGKLVSEELDIKF